jgi:cell division protein FtsB
MGKSSESVDQLVVAQEKLKSEHAKLVKEFEKLHRAKFSQASHTMFLEKLKAHLLALEAHTAAIHAQHESLHARSETVHKQHEAEAPQPSRSSQKPRNPRSR